MVDKGKEINYIYKRKQAGEIGVCTDGFASRLCDQYVVV